MRSIPHQANAVRPRTHMNTRIVVDIPNGHSSMGCGAGSAGTTHSTDADAIAPENVIASAGRTGSGSPSTTTSA